MTERAEYFAILASLAATGDYNSVTSLVEGAYQIWAAGNRICREAGLENEEAGK